MNDHVPLLADALDGAGEPLEPRRHLLGVEPVQHPAEVLDDLTRVVVGDLEERIYCQPCCSHF